MKFFNYQSYTVTSFKSFIISDITNSGEIIINKDIIKTIIKMLQPNHQYKVNLYLNSTLRIGSLFDKDRIKKYITIKLCDDLLVTNDLSYKDLNTFLNKQLDNTIYDLEVEDFSHPEIIMTLEKLKIKKYPLAIIYNIINKCKGVSI